MIFLIFIVSFIVTFLSFPVIIPRLKEAGIVGKNMNSELKEEIPEIVGLIIVVGFSSAIILIIFLKVFLYIICLSFIVFIDYWLFSCIDGNLLVEN